MENKTKRFYKTGETVWIVAEKKEEMSRIGGSKEEQKKILKEQLEQMRKQFEYDKEVWNKEPEVSSAKLAEYKKAFEALQKDVENSKEYFQQEAAFRLHQ
jgi:hypothetical protein